jgi:hypothetical protein
MVAALTRSLYHKGIYWGWPRLEGIGAKPVLVVPMNFADPAFWVQKTNMAELLRDQEIRDKVDVEEKAAIAGAFRDKQNAQYLSAVRHGNNANMLKTLVTEVEGWARRRQLPMDDVQVVSPARWTQDGKLTLELRIHPEAWSE